jgi:acyl carrier protein
MKYTSHETVTAALADHLDVDPLAIVGTQDLEDDWGLDALDLVLLALRVEDMLDVRVPLDALEGARTVADFARVVRGAERPTALEAREADFPPTTPGAGPTRERMRRRGRRTWEHRAHRDARRAHRRAG